MSIAFVDHSLIDVSWSTPRRYTGAVKHRKTEMRHFSSFKNLIMLVSNRKVSQGRFHMLSQASKTAPVPPGYHEYDTAMPGGGCHAPHCVRTSNRGIFHLHLPRATKEQKMGRHDSPHPERCRVCSTKADQAGKSNEATGVSSRAPCKASNDAQQPGTARHGAHAQECVIAVDRRVREKGVQGWWRPDLESRSEPGPRLREGV